MTRHLAIVCLVALGLLSPLAAGAQDEEAYTEEQFRNDLCVISEVYARIAMTERQEGASADELAERARTLFQAESERDPDNRDIYQIFLYQAERIIQEAFKGQVYEDRLSKDAAVEEFVTQILSACHQGG